MVFLGAPPHVGRDPTLEGAALEWRAMQKGRDESAPGAEGS